MSYGVTIRLVTKLGEGHDAEVLKWKKCLTNFLSIMYTIYMPNVLHIGLEKAKDVFKMLIPFEHHCVCT